jgi:hypothetical protein
MWWIGVITAQIRCITNLNLVKSTSLCLIDSEYFSLVTTIDSFFINNNSLVHQSYNSGLIGNAV